MSGEPTETRPTRYPDDHMEGVLWDRARDIADRDRYNEYLCHDCGNVQPPIAIAWAGLDCPSCGGRFVGVL